MKTIYFKKNTATTTSNKLKKDGINEGIGGLLDELKKYHDRYNDHDAYNRDEKGNRGMETDHSEKMHTLLEAVFKERIYQASKKNRQDNSLEEELEKEYRHSVKLLEKFLDKNPEAADDYVELIETIGNMARAKGQRRSIVPVLRTTLKTIDGWDLRRKEKTYAKLHVLRASLERCIGIIATLNNLGLLHKKNADKNVVEIYSTPDNRMIDAVLTRGLNALKRCYSREIRETIIGIFAELDRKIIKSIKFGKRFNLLSDNFIDSITKLNERLANAIGNISGKDELHKLLTKITDALERDDGLKEIGRLLNELENPEKIKEERAQGNCIIIKFSPMSAKSQN